MARFDHNNDFENTVISWFPSLASITEKLKNHYNIKAMDYCSDYLKVMMNLEQGKKLHESWDPYLPTMIRDEVYSWWSVWKTWKSREMGTCHDWKWWTREQFRWWWIPMDSLNALPLSRSRKNPNQCSSWYVRVLLAAPSIHSRSFSVLVDTFCFLYPFILSVSWCRSATLLMTTVLVLALH